MAEDMQSRHASGIAARRKRSGMETLTDNVPLSCFNGTYLAAA
jgi:hypothetical protein